jgi:uncharacterized protein with von Willebrand factor type A (vWA) domain
MAAFGHVLHASGVPVTPERSTRFASAISVARPKDLTELYWLGRVTLLTRHDQVETYDAVFSQVFRGVVDVADYRGQSNEPAPPESTPAGDREQGDPERPGESSVGPHGTNTTPGESRDDGEDDDEPSVLAAVSQVERLSDRAFAACSQEELELIRRLVEQLPLVPPLRTGRRRRKHAQGRRLDVRATLRRSHRTGGDPVDLVKRRRTKRPRRVVLIADVSGSMEPYTRIYLHLMRGAVRALHAEAFVFATRLTRLTRALSLTHTDIAYRKVTETATDWSGGTRIGGALTQFLDQYGRRGMARGAVVVIVSDGWELEDPARVGQAMERLSRLAHHVVWVNPRKSSIGYQPLVGGMAAAMPYVDTFVSGHSVRALEEVIDAIRHATDRSGFKA